MATGIVTNYDSGRAFGFIRPDDHRAPDLFVHARHISNREYLKAGQRVSFEVVDDERSGRPRADRVRVI